MKWGLISPGNGAPALLVVMLLFSPLPAHAGTRELNYDLVDVQMTMNKDTSIDVIETQKVTLSGDWNGLFRDYKLTGCDNVRIAGVWENDQAYREGDMSRKGGYVVTRKKKGNSVQVKWRSRNVKEKPYRNHRTTFTVKYTLIGAVGQYWRRDVFCWKPIMSDREHAVSRATVTLRLPHAPDAWDVTFYCKAPEAR